MQIFRKVFSKKYVCTHTRKLVIVNVWEWSGGQVGWEAIWLYTLKAGLYAKSGFLWIVRIKTTP